VNTNTVVPKVHSHLFKQGSGSIVKVTHQVLKQEEQAGQVKYLRVLQNDGEVEPLDRRGDALGTRQQDRLLLHQRDRVEQEQEQLGMFHVQV
jgi:hypothetical protein